jgi:hypothetical protein
MTADRKSRLMFAYNLRKQRLTFKQIGERMGVSSGRAREIFRMAEWMVNHGEHWTDGLSTRSANCLCNNDINSREAALEAYQSGKLNPDTKFGNPGTRSYGWKSHKEVAKWLGLPEPQKPLPRVYSPKVCPHCGGKLNE